jgi:hypothetical protein
LSPNLTANVLYRPMNRAHNGAPSTGKSELLKTPAEVVGGILDEGRPERGKGEKAGPVDSGQNAFKFLAMQHPRATGEYPWITRGSTRTHLMLTRTGTVNSQHGPLPDPRRPGLTHAKS